jgi:hypothetical protein
MDDANLVEKLDLKHSCFGKRYCSNGGMGKRVVMLVLQNMGKSKYLKKMDFMSI